MGPIYSVDLRLSPLACLIPATTNEGFQEAPPSGLHLFSLPPPMTSVERIYYDE
jgi:hypothetical protein